MFVRKKNNKSGSVSIQIIDKSYRRYKVLITQLSHIKNY